MAVVVVIVVAAAAGEVHRQSGAGRQTLTFYLSPGIRKPQQVTSQPPNQTNEPTRQAGRSQRVIILMGIGKLETPFIVLSI